MSTHAPSPHRRGTVVAVDGPSGSGKSSVCRAVAARLGWRYVDTGATYRAVTWAALDAGTDLDDRAAVADLARTVDLRLSTDPADPSVRVGDVDVTAAIRTSELSSVVSRVATNLDVRAALVDLARELIGDGDVVVEGRDTTTVIAPDADVRLLLTADEQARLARRAREVRGSDDAAALRATRDEVLRRDADDSTVVEFRTAADGVVEIDTSALDLDQVVAAVLAQIALVAPDAGAATTTAPTGARS